MAITKKTNVKKTNIKKTNVKAMTKPKVKIAKKAAPKKPVVKKPVVKKTQKPKAQIAKTAKKPIKKVIAKKIIKKPVKKIIKKIVKKSAPKFAQTPLLKEVLKVLDTRQASNIVTMSLEGRSAMADFVVIASGNSGRQIAAIADYLRDVFMTGGMKNVRVEGIGAGDWVLVDGGDIIVHLFRPEVRDYYKIENLWQKEPAPAVARAGNGR